MNAPAAHPDTEAAAAVNARIRCGYLLHGLPDDGNCPECGTPVAQSGEPVSLLRDQDPAWLGRIAEGLSWQIAANLVGLTSTLLDALSGWRQAEAVAPERFPLPTILSGLLILLNFVAAWWITAPEPAKAEREVSFRRAVRLVAVVAVPAALLLHFYPFSSSHRWAGVYFVNALLTLADVILWYAYVRQLAMRVPSPGLAFQGLLLLCGAAIDTLFTWVLPSTGYVLFYYAGTYVGDVYSFSATPPAQIVGMALTTYAIYFCFLLRRALLRERSPAALRADDETAAGS